MKKAYRIYCERDTAEIAECCLQKSQALVGIHRGNVVISPPCMWQKRYNASDVTVENRMDTLLSENHC